MSDIPVLTLQAQTSPELTPQTERVIAAPAYSIIRRCAAEYLGTFWLVFGGCGSAVLSAAFPSLGIGFLGVALAFGLTVVTMAFAIGHISGCHLNPAVSLGLLVGKRFAPQDLIQYVCAQVMGGISATWALFAIASGTPAYEMGGFAANGYGLHSPGGYRLSSGFIAESLLTFFFLLIILGVTSKKATGVSAPLAIGLGLTLIHLIGIPVTNLSVNPARATATAVIVGGWAMDQLWLFWLAPMIGAAMAGIIYPLLDPEG